MNRQSAQGAGSKTTSKTPIVVLSLGLLLSIGLLVALIVHIARQSGYEEQYLLRASEQRVVSQRIEKSALAATSGKQEVLIQLRTSRDEFERLVNELKAGVPALGVPPAPAEVANELKAMDDAWQRLGQNADDILSNQQSIVSVREFVGSITGLIPQLEERSGELISRLVDSGANAGLVELASEQLMLAGRIDKNVSNVLQGGATTEAAIGGFSKDMERFRRLLDSVKKSSSSLAVEGLQNAGVQQKLTELTDVFLEIEANASQIIETVPALLPALNAIGQASDNSDSVNKVASDLIDALGKGPGRFSIGGLQAGPIMVAVVSIFGALFLLLIMVIQINNSKRREADSKQQNERNQQAILRLLDEMGDLADGDLTVTATVTEDVTGAIADSINYAIEALRSLVTTINQTSTKVSNSAQESRATAMHLAEASDHQAEQLVSTTYSIKEMTLAMDQMASDATESSEIAQRSVEIAAKGASTVRHTIQGMDTIREQIQETSKRIKRLGESSQEIGDIVELIDDIADQTNILALNAAMQAAMAGEAGRGFAVVADEVQRLAERSSNATKQIEALVKTIRADTNEAVSSMENTTRDVVSGAKLSEDAGEALKEIENVSQHISERISSVAASAQKQSNSAGRIDQTMGVIREITTQTSDSTSQTAASIGVLADLAEELQHSVSGFRLPK